MGISSWPENTGQQSNRPEPTQQLVYKISSGIEEITADEGLSIYAILLWLVRREGVVGPCGSIVGLDWWKRQRCEAASLTGLATIFIGLYSDTSKNEHLGY